MTSGADWYLLYTVSAAIATINVAFLLYAFRLRPAITDPDAHQSATLVEILRTPLCLLFCAFYLVCACARGGRPDPSDVGLEVTVGGWTVRFASAGQRALTQQLPDRRPGRSDLRGLRVQRVLRCVAPIVARLTLQAD